jgi:hypothetical protein
LDLERHSFVVVDFGFLTTLKGGQLLQWFVFESAAAAEILISIF